MTSYPGNQIPTYDINLIGMQMHNLQQQMTEYGRIVSQQQQAIMQLLQKQQAIGTVQWPSIRDHRYQQLIEKNTRNSSSFPAVLKKPQFNSRKRTPKNITLGDFMPKTARKGQKFNKQNHVQFTNHKHGKKNEQTRKDKTKNTNVNKEKQIQVGKTKAKVTDAAKSFNITLANRFLPLTIDSSDDELVREVDLQRRQPRTTASNLDTDTPIVTKTIVSNNKNNKNSKAKKKNFNNLRITLATDQPRIVTEVPRTRETTSVNIPKFHKRPYLESNKIREWLMNNIHSEQDGQIVTASQGANEHIDQFVKFAIKTAFTFDQLARALFNVQIWSFYIQLGTREHQPYWAKEVVSIAKTREETQARRVCENKIVKLNAEIKRLSEEIQTIAVEHNLTKDEYEEVMFKYMNESLANVRKQNELKMKMAKIERAEYVAWENFMNIATPSQKSLALTIKDQLTQVRAKSIQYETAATHATPHVDILPKVVPALKLRFRFDEKSMSEENVKDIYKTMDDITREYRLKATELYIRTTKVELDYHTTRLRHLIDGSVLALSEKSEENNEGIEAFQIFIKVHRHYTAALAETSALRLKERHQKIDAPDPALQKTITTADTSLIPVPELLKQVGQIQETLLLNRN